MSGTVTLPWPPKQLSPNARVHWAVLAREKKKYREAAFWITKESKVKAPQEGTINISLVFHPPDRRHRDIDNCLASLKAGIDGIADALQVNDKRFAFALRMSDEVGGVVKVSIA